MAVLVISYSRVDQPLVRAVVSLLKAALRQINEAVFWDDELEPGEPWFAQLKQSIDAAPQLFVFWCEHSAGSRQVRREFMYALERKKRVVPVLLDDTPLAPRLAPIEGIDLRGVILHPTTGVDAAKTRPAQPKAARELSAIGWPVVLSMALASYFGWRIDIMLGALVVLLVASILWVLFVDRHSGTDPQQDERPNEVISSSSKEREWIVRQFAKHLAAEGANDLSVP